MSKTARTKHEIIEAITAVAAELGRPPSRLEFRARTGINEYQIERHFDTWNEAVHAAGLEPHTKNVRIDDSALLDDWGQVVRRLRQIPTHVRYRREGSYSPDVFQGRFGAWSKMPDVFRDFANGKPEWADVVALLPVPAPTRQPAGASAVAEIESVGATRSGARARHSKLSDRATYGNPIDFRGLRHEPVNEQGVVFLFGMVAKEMGYMVEAVQTGYPDCEAKRQIGPNNWQRVRIEFEFESRNFHEHGHSPDGCDVIVCWRHNWPECPEHVEVVELSSAIQTLSKGED